ncbi:hypothetical protein [Cupriavidus sp. WS]|uniref:hypothetical protein n=1 Tax=Cupriavidus sp. WS TaxID=1312922 RepID=UPI00035C4356|nr:hypothetical protein [Cupriavidus sp. WS]
MIPSPFKKPYTLDELEARIASHDYSAEMLLQHAMELLRAQAAPSDPTMRFMADVSAELRRARAKFPGDRIMTIALAEEFGELCKAILDEPGANVWKEAVQTAVMAARVAIDGDSSVDEWRSAKGLDNHRAIATHGAAKWSSDKLDLDVEQLLRDTVPGGSVCDPQQVADSIRAWFERRAVGADDPQDAARFVALLGSMLAHMNGSAMTAEQRRVQAAFEVREAAPLTLQVIRDRIDAALRTNTGETA